MIGALLARRGTSRADPSSRRPGIVTDLYPKVRRAVVGDGSIVGIAKGAGMIEPNLRDDARLPLHRLRRPRDELRSALAPRWTGFNRMSIDSDTSTSDTVALLSRAASRATSTPSAPLARVCADLTEDVVRNGEGSTTSSASPSAARRQTLALGVGEAVVNSPLLQCAICGNDPNVGRLVMAIGKHVSAAAPASTSRCTLSMAGRVIFADGAFRLDHGTEESASSPT